MFSRLFECLGHFFFIHQLPLLVIGDRYLTGTYVFPFVDFYSSYCYYGFPSLDVVLARANGFIAIHVDPFDISRDNFVVRMIRSFENQLARIALRLTTKTKD